jgi:MFS family permease
MKYQIPRPIKRNMALFCVSMSFTGAGMQFTYGFGPLMVLTLTGSSSLAGISVGLIGLSRFIVAYPVGKISDAYGRKPGVMLGLVLAMVGALALGSAMQVGSIAIFVAGLLVFAMGMNAAQQMRVGAADMFPHFMRAEALGYVALGSLFGLVLSPTMVNIADVVGKAYDLEPLGLPWFFLPVLIVGGMVVVSFVRPDPKEIGMNLDRYYPGYVAPPRPGKASRDQKFSIMDVLRDRRTRLAIVSNCAASGNMSIVMVLTSLVLSHHGHSLVSIAYSHMFHSAGMFAFTIPLGRLADRFGRSRVMYPGVAVSLVGALCVGFSGDYAIVTLGTFLVGIGWAAANVAATATVADQAVTEQRGRAIGVSDSCAGAVNVGAALVTGPLIELYGLPATGLTAALLAAVPFAMLVVGRERSAR